MRMLKLDDKGVSTVFGSILFIILVLALASTLFLALYEYNQVTQEALMLEETRAQERIALISLATENVSEVEYVTALLVNNTGSVTCRIRAVYVDNVFLCDPSDPAINAFDTYINAKESRWVMLPPNIAYNATSKFMVVTERGIKSVEHMWKLKRGSQAQPPPEPQRFHFGPLLLDFEKFYYAECSPDGSFDSNSWKPGWSVEKGARVVWNITVKNIDDRDITINKYSAFTLVSNDGGVQIPWFIEPPGNSDILHIKSNGTVHLVYIWDRPRLTQGVSTQTVYNQPDRSKVFLTFYGFFHEHDGTTKPYGQTIPFEAVLVREPQMVISANPSVIAAGSTMTSTITVVVRNVYGAPASYVTVSFTTTLGSLSSPTATTNADGIATVTLYPESTTGTATITATWEDISKSTTVTIASGTLEVSANPNTIAAGSTMNSTITATVQLNGNPLAGETVTFSAASEGMGTLSNTQAVTNAQGHATASFIPASTTGTVTITASWATLTQSTSVNIVQAAIQVSASPTTIAAGSTMTSTITATVIFNGNPEVNALVAFSTNASSLSSSIAYTDTSGQAAVTLSPGETPTVANVTATWQGISSSTIVTIAQGTITISAEPPSIPLNSTATITALVQLDGNPVAGAEVTFNATIGNLSNASAITDENGSATVYFSSEAAGTGIVTATWQGLSTQTLVTVNETP